jgi:hypothetical protein
LLKVKAPFALTTRSRPDGLSYYPIVDLLANMWGNVREKLDLLKKIDALGIDWKPHHFCSGCSISGFHWGALTVSRVGFCPVWGSTYDPGLNSALVGRGAIVVKH